VPANGYLNDSFRSGWTCERGFVAEDGACTAIAVPVHGYLTATTYGPGWACDRGYRVENDACIAVEIPVNGYLSDAAYGPGWQCERGFRASDLSCVAMPLPENAHVDHSGNDWGCDPPYRKRRDVCTPR
jgi:hypothetical protein